MDKLMLSGEKLKTLGKLIQQQEENRIMSIPFKSEMARAQYLEDSKEAHNTAVGLVDKGAEAYKTLSNNPTTTEITLHYLKYLEYGVNSALRTMWNLHLRDRYLKKIRAHADTLEPMIKDIKDRFEWGADDEAQLKAEAKELIKKLTVYKDAQYQYMLKWKNPVARNFTLALHKKGTTYERMVEKYQLKLVREKGPEYGGLFEELDDEKKIEVYDEIAKSSGRGSLLTNTAGTVFDAVGLAVLVIALGMMVWDIYTSENKVKTTTIEGTKLLATVGGSFLGEFAGAAAGTAIAATTLGAETAAALATAVGVEVAAVTSAFVCLTAFVTGIGLAIALGAAAGWLAVKMFETGGKHASKVVTVQSPNKPEQLPDSRPKTSHVYVAPMPDGNLLARQLAYQGARA